jgi:hypothetical protein
MSRAGNLEVNPLLALEQNLPVINLAGGVHEPVGFDQLLAGESLILAGDLFVGHTGRIQVSFRCHPLAYCRQATALL